MFCPRCATRNDENAWKCVSCGQELPRPVSGGPADPPEKIETYLTQSILATLCCCLPLGVVAIYYAAQANANAGAGNVKAAREASRLAHLWCWIAFGFGFIGSVIMFALQFIAAMAGVK